MPTTVTSTPEDPILARKRPQGSGYVNLQSYLGLNDPQGGAMAAGLGADAQAQTDSARRGLTGVQDQFNQSVSAATLSGPAQKYDSLFAAPGLPEDEATLGRAAPRILDPVEGQRLATLRDARYTGPTQLQDMGSYAAAKAQAQKARIAGAGLDNENSRQDALAQKYGQNGYGVGKRGLDSYLTSQSSQGQSVIKGARRDASALDQMLGLGEVQARQRGQAGADASAAASAQAGQAIANAGQIQATQDKAWADAQARARATQREQARVDALDRPERNRKGKRGYGSDDDFVQAAP